MEQFQALIKALEAGSYNAAPGTLVNGSATQHEDLSPVMHNVCMKEDAIKMQKSLQIKEVKSNLAQFNRQLSYGALGGSAQFEGAIGQDNTPDVVRAIVPMAYYSKTTRVTTVADMISRFDGKKAEDFAAESVAKTLAMDIEFEIYKGMADFSNAGVFDGSVGAIADLPNMFGLDQQIRQSDGQASTQDQMFNEFGSDQSVVLAADGSLTQSLIEDAAVRSHLNMGDAHELHLDPVSLSAYNKIAHVKERIMLAGSAQESTGAALRQQWTSAGGVELMSSHFLRGKTRPGKVKNGAPSAPGALTSADAGAAGSLLSAGSYVYYVTACNEIGESPRSPVATQAVAADGNAVTVTWAGVGSAKFYNVYRSDVGGAARDAFYIGRIKQGASNPVFTDLGAKSPGFVTGYLLQKDTFALHQLAGFSSVELAKSDLSSPRASYRFVCLASMEPRKNILLDNLDGQL